ncbi:MAG: hypothetical protein NC324_02315 [Bacteroides sp.]|nr:hypothetical protein [Bacteroides sp.]
MAGLAKKFWNLSRNNKKKTVIAAYNSVADKCSCNLDSAKVNAHAVLKKWHYFDQGSQANREKWGECETFWMQNVSKKVLVPALENCVQSEMDYRDEHNMGYDGPREVISYQGGNVGSGTINNTNTNTTNNNGSIANQTASNGGSNRTVKILLLAVAAVAGFMLIKKKK